MDGYQSILVHLDASPRCAERLAMARKIAPAHGAATLIALLAIEPRLLPLPLRVDVEALAVPIVPQIDPEHRDFARTLFNGALASGDPAMTWAEVPGDPPVWGTAQASLYVDLMVLGQHDPEEPRTRDVPRDFVESVVMESGKPALVLPYVGRYPAVGQNVLIAWKPTRECARAVAGALPLIRRAKRVHVVSWGPDNYGPAETTFGIVRALRWHGVEASANRYPDEPSELGELLLSHAADQASDLLVMGCYGHHRIHELLLGGVTRTVLRSMTLPVLMAH
ncbi:universal stress protein [Variovorax sp. J22R24]|uniref:universal stress protein n=1 Tax=Variovorax gracilis TaxID=3053502 RepID=UPI002574ED39|nr:universal stress protein [Variovorax sp. J22R24]MDM0109552.1 universal stress protein [Variovorax sp. J22R24]